MEVTGLPLHPLVVHAAVVLGPLAALTALAHAVAPPLRHRLRVPVVSLALVAGLAVVAAHLSGRSLLDSRPELAQVPAVGTHVDRAGVTLWVTLAFTVVALATVMLHGRTGTVQVLTNVLLGLASLATLVMVVLTGDAGTRAVWGR